VNSLQDDIIALTSFFCVNHNKENIKNYHLFRNSLKKQGIKLCTVELALNGRPFELTNNDADILLQVRSNSVLWHKEHLLNLGLKKIPKKYTKIACLDADIIFINPNWVKEASDALNKFTVLQLFDTAINLSKGKSTIDKNEIKTLPVSLRDSAKYEGIIYALNRNNLFDITELKLSKIGRTGLAWGFKRDCLKNGFFDKSIAGSGDLLMVNGMFTTSTNNLSLKYFNKSVLSEYSKWVTKFNKRVNKKVGYLPGKILHLWHGSRRNRNYFSRQAILNQIGFDFSEEIILNKDNCFEFGGNSLAGQWLKIYFFVRNEQIKPLSYLASPIFYLTSYLITRIKNIQHKN